MSTGKRFSFPLIIGLILGLCMLTAVVAENGASGAAFNSDGKGEVMVSCNGKTYKGEGMAACTSLASSTKNSFGGLMITIAVHVVINFVKM